MNNGRRKRIAALIKSVQQIQEALAAAPVLEDLQSELESIQEEEQEAYDNMPSDLQESDRGQEAQSRLDNMESCKDQILDLSGALDTLDEIVSSLEEIAQ